MLKDIFKKNNKNNSSIKDKIANSLMDGYVDIKAYRHNDNGEKKLVYHDTGDNTVTNWMRQVIMQLLAGVPFSDLGFGAENEDPFNNNINFTTYVNKNHSNSKNIDGTLVSGTDYQYLHNGDDFKNISSYASSEGHPYPLYPTKVLFGTGKEYVSWDALQEENENNNAAWYSEMIDSYSGGEGEASAREHVDNLIKGEIGCNTYSSTYSAQGVHSGGGNMLPAITVNDPDPDSILEESPADLSRRYGVVGAIKTIYLPSDSDKQIDDGTVEDVLNPTVSDDGKLIKARYRGVGRPCFIYLNRTIDTKDGGNKLDWSLQTSSVYVSKENSVSVPYLNRITFKVVMPAQKGVSMNNAYYPYNGYTLKQVGLFNDALMCSKEGVPNTNSTKMPCGMLLAIKNIATFTKTADEEIVFTWTLTI